MRPKEVQHVVRIDRERIFYRNLLEDIANIKPRTLGVRLADSGLTFWDSMSLHVKHKKPA